MATAPTFAYHAPQSIPRAPHPRARALHIAGAVSAAVLLAIPFVAVQQGDPGSAAAALVPLPSVRPISAGQAHSAPGEITPAAFAIDAAKPFIPSYGDAASAARAENCLTEAIYYEGALEPERGQRAIAQVVLNRVRHPAYPDTVCGVVFQGQERSTGCQFTFTCDGARARGSKVLCARRAAVPMRMWIGSRRGADGRGAGEGTLPSRCDARVMHGRRAGASTSDAPACRADTGKQACPLMPLHPH
jgi:hypothetical protein